MKISSARADHRQEKDFEKAKQNPEVLHVSIQQIQERASTQTELLVHILERPHVNYMRYRKLDE